MNKTTKISNWTGLARGAALVARMYPNYALFAEVSGSGNSAVFKNILNLVWEYIAGDNQSIDFDKQQDKLTQITPNPELFDGYGVWPALDASVALASLLNACERNSDDELNEISVLSTSTIANYLEFVGEDNNGEHELEKTEQQFCEQLDSVISAAEPDRREIARQIKRLLSDWNVSNIGLELD